MQSCQQTFIDQSFDCMSHAVMLFIPPAPEESYLYIDEALLGVSSQFPDHRVQDVLHTCIGNILSG